MTAAMTLLHPATFAGVVGAVVIALALLTWLVVEAWMVLRGRR